jgi:hypothetical protein
MKLICYVFGILVPSLVFLFSQTADGQSACAQAILFVTNSWNPSFTQGEMSGIDFNCVASPLASGIVKAPLVWCMFWRCV